MPLGHEYEVLVVDLIAVNANQNDFVAAAGGKFDHCFYPANSHSFKDMQIIHGMDAGPPVEAGDFNSIQFVFEAKYFVHTPICCEIGKYVASLAAPQQIIALAAVEAIVANAAPNRIVSDPAAQIVRIQSAIQAVITFTTNDDIVAGLPPDGVVPCITGQHIVLVAAENQVIAAAAGDVVIAVIGVDRLINARADEFVVLVRHQELFDTDDGVALGNPGVSGGVHQVHGDADFRFQ